MVTTIRSTRTEKSENDTIVRGDTLLKNASQSFDEFKNPTHQDENMQQAKLRMQRNLDKILNYDKAPTVTKEIEDSIAVEEKPVVEQSNISVENVIKSDEDIRPTSTTMQFGTDDINQIYQDIARQKEEERVSYHLNRKGKMALVLYSLAVVVVMALIVLNTGVLSTLSSKSEARAKLLNEKMQEYSQISEELESISSNEYVSNIAENEYGMIKG